MNLMKCRQNLTAFVLGTYRTERVDLLRSYGCLYRSMTGRNKAIIRRFARAMLFFQNRLRTQKVRIFRSLIGR